MRGAGVREAGEGEKAVVTERMHYFTIEVKEGGAKKLYEADVWVRESKNTSSSSKNSSPSPRTPEPKGTRSWMIIRMLLEHDAAWELQPLVCSNQKGLLLYMLSGCRRPVQQLIAT